MNIIILKILMSPWSLEFPVKSNISKTKTIRPKVTQDGITDSKSCTNSNFT